MGLGFEVDECEVVSPNVGIGVEAPSLAVVAVRAEKRLSFEESFSNSFMSRSRFPLSLKDLSYLSTLVTLLASDAVDRDISTTVRFLSVVGEEQVQQDTGTGEWSAKRAARGNNKLRDVEEEGRTGGGQQNGWQD